MRKRVDVVTAAEHRTRRDEFVDALDTYLAAVGSDPDDVSDIAAAQELVIDAFSALQDEVVERTGWSLSLVDEADDVPDDDDGAIRAARHEIRIEVRPTRIKRLDKLLASHLREQGIDKADVARMRTGDLLEGVVHGLTSELAALLEDAAAMEVTISHARG